MRPVRLAVSLDHYYYATLLEQRVEMLDIYVELDHAVIEATGLASLLFREHNFNSGAVMDAAETECYSALYDIYIDEFESDVDDAHSALMAMTALVKDTYLVIVGYAKYLISLGYHRDDVIDNITFVYFEVQEEYCGSDQQDEIFILAKAMEQTDFEVPH